ncbi:hypothetical protein [Sphingomonas sp. YL-JM2C]
MVSVIAIPPRFASPSLPLGHYYVAILETDAEVTEFDAYLAAPRPAPIAPTLFERRPSGLAATHMMVGSYLPPEPGWPYIILVHCPPDSVESAPVPDDFLRGAYSLNLFATEHEFRRAWEEMFAGISPKDRSNLLRIEPVDGDVGTA